MLTEIKIDSTSVPVSSQCIKSQCFSRGPLPVSPTRAGTDVAVVTHQRCCGLGCSVPFSLRFVVWQSLGALSPRPSLVPSCLCSNQAVRSERPSAGPGGRHAMRAAPARSRRGLRPWRPLPASTFLPLWSASWQVWPRRVHRQGALVWGPAVQGASSQAVACGAPTTRSALGWAFPRSHS